MQIIRKRLVNNRYYQVQKVQARHREIARLILIGLKDTVIAETMDITAQTVRNTKNNPMIKKQLDLMLAVRDVEAIDVARRIQKIAPMALDLLEDILNGKVEKPELDSDKYEMVSVGQRFTAARDWLNRAGHGEIKKVAGVIGHGYLSSDDVDELKKRADSVRKNSIDLKDIEEAEVVTPAPEAGDAPFEASSIL